MKAEAVIFTILPVAAFIAGYWLHSPEPQAEIEHLPTIKEVQTALQSAGYYEGEVDGILGPLTQIAWDRYSNDKEAAKSWTESGAPE